MEWMFQTKTVEKNKKIPSVFIKFFHQLCHLWDNVEKCGRAIQATGDSIMLHSKDALCMPGN